MIRNDAKTSGKKRSRCESGRTVEKMAKEALTDPEVRTVLVESEGTVLIVGDGGYKSVRGVLALRGRSDFRIQDAILELTRSSPSSYPLSEHASIHMSGHHWRRKSGS
jgi:hypothetical protein